MLVASDYPGFIPLKNRDFADAHSHWLLPKFLANVIEASCNLAMVSAMKKRPSRKKPLPSFDELTAKSPRCEKAIRLHPSALPKTKPSGEMRVYGVNPAWLWLENLHRTNHQLGNELLAQLKGLTGSSRSQLVWTAYLKEFYAADRSGIAPISKASPDELMDFDFNSLFKLPPTK